MPDPQKINSREGIKRYVYLMERYFRKTPPVPTNVYLSPEVMEDEELKIQIARHCHFPAILNILANDENEKVRSMAQNSEFWKLIGRYQDILGFDRRERRTFALNEGQPNILVLLMFEDDLDVLTDVLQNPNVSLKMLTLFLKLINERGNGRKDQQIYEITRQILKQRKTQIIKISTINRAAEEITKSENILLILKSFTDEDANIRKAAENLLQIQDAQVIRFFVAQALDEKKFTSLLEQFIILSGLIDLISKRQDLLQISVSALHLPRKEKQKGKFHSIGHFFINLLTTKRIQLVKQSAADLTDFHNVTLLAHCHVSKEGRLRKLAGEILPVQDIISLLDEVSTPRKVFKEILIILEGHSDEQVIELVHESYLRETHRLRESLKELELTVQAYFDIIFQSLGYNQINQYMNVVRAINSTRKQIDRFDTLLKEKMGDKREDLDGLLNDVKTILKRKANFIYFDTGSEVVRELNMIFGLIEEIFDLKDMGLSSLRPGTPQDVESEVQARARIIWQSAISSYLGRIKDLSEMIRKKIIKIGSKPYGREAMQKEVADACLDLEKSYKEKVACKLTIPCKICSKRGCASERFLQETHFFIKELLDNFTDHSE